jgi:rSAM-associated Gly-rich repeat protein
MATLPRPGLFGFLLLLAALAPSPSLAARGATSDPAAGPQAYGSDPAPLVAPGSVDARLSRISAALRERGLVGDGAQVGEGDDGPGAMEGAGEGVPGRGGDSRLAWVFVNAPSAGFRNGGWGNGGFRNGGWGNGGFRNGGFGNGGFRNGGAWRNGGGGAWRNGGFRNHW